MMNIQEINKHLVYPDSRVLVVYDNHSEAIYNFKKIVEMSSKSVGFEVSLANLNIKLPHGAELYFSHCARDEDSFKFRGQNYSKIFLETCFTRDVESRIMNREVPWRFKLHG